MMNTENSRLHHTIKWVNTTPVIIAEKYRKVIGLVDIISEESIYTKYPDSVIIKYDPPAQVIIPDTEIIATQPMEVKPYTGKYIVSWTYDIFEEDGCLFKPRFVGTYQECETFIAESKQPYLF